MFIRENVISFCKRFEIYILFILKLSIGLLVFGIINDIGFAREEFVRYVSAPLRIPYIFLFSLLFAVAPYIVGYFLMMLAICIQLSSSIEVTVLVLIFMLCIMFFYVRMAPKECILILATILAFYFKIPYAVLLFAGLYMGITSIIPITIGVFIWEFIPSVFVLMNTTRTAGTDFMEMASTFPEVYVQMLQQFSTNTDWIFVAFVFCMIVLAVYGISRLSIDYSKELAIGLGAVLNVLAFIIVVLITRIEINLVFMFLSTLISVMIVEVIHFFDILLDYSRAESVQFEDDENYYYVKVVPKVAIAKKKRVVKRIRPNET